MFVQHLRRHSLTVSVFCLAGCSSGETTQASDLSPSNGSQPGVTAGTSTGGTGTSLGTGGSAMTSSGAGGSGVGGNGTPLGSGGSANGSGGDSGGSGGVASGSGGADGGGGSTSGSGGNTADSGCAGEPDYELLWEDQFEGTALNTEYWTQEDGGSSNWNNTAVDDPRVVEVSFGTLKLKAIKNPNFTSNLSTVGLGTTLTDTHVWTGAVDSRRKVDFKYGKIEIRARLESAPRAWPAIWMMPTESVYGGNPDSGEIDIVERLNDDSFYYSTVHTYYHTSNKSDPERYTTESAATIDEWTVFTVEWTADKIEFFRNGSSYHVVNRATNATDPEWHRWPFKEDFYIILSQQVGGGWVDGGASRPLADSDVPFEMEVDYVRVCQKKE